MKKQIIIGCDNAALDLKYHIIQLMEHEKIQFEDVGVYSKDDEEIYPVIAERVVRKIIDSGYMNEGILICGTGIGMAITANKFSGIYAAVCHDSFSAERAKLSNDTNILTLGARVIGSELAKKIVKEWIELKFVDGRSSAKVNQIKKYESNNFK